MPGAGVIAKWVLAHAMVFGQAGSIGADAYFTDHNLGKGYHEFNPIAAPFVRNRTDLIVSNSIGLSLTLLGEHLLRKHHHGKLAKMLEISMIAGHTYGATASAENFTYGRH